MKKINFSFVLGMICSLSPLFGSDHFQDLTSDQEKLLNRVIRVGDHLPNFDADQQAGLDNYDNKVLRQSKEAAYRLYPVYPNYYKASLDRHIVALRSLLLKPEEKDRLEGTKVAIIALKDQAIKANDSQEVIDTLDGQLEQINIRLQDHEDTATQLAHFEQQKAAIEEYETNRQKYFASLVLEVFGTLMGPNPTDSSNS